MSRRQQLSKRARKHKKQAEFASIGRLVGHPSHASGIRRMERVIAKPRWTRDLHNHKQLAVEEKT